MDEQRQQLTDRIKQAQNILVAVSANPSVDQLSAAIGLTLALNKLDKHGTAVFSGQVPDTLEFLKPEETLEKNTDSLRDFIIALDKSKADKLRYKVENDVVRIFITPYKTSLSEQDLDFSQGDFNVDVVVALGVTDQQDLDTAITTHGRILHDATVASVSTAGQGSLGSINWVDPTASSLSEMVVSLCDGLDKKLLDGQIATALLTGIVATTGRFSNEKTTPKTMSASAELMAAGANQQLIATELEPAPGEPPVDQNQTAEDIADTPSPQKDPGMLEIDHDTEPDEPDTPPPPPAPQVHVDDEGHLVSESDQPAPASAAAESPAPPVKETGPTEVKHERVDGSPSLPESNLTANIEPERLDPSTEELTLPPVSAPLLSHNENVLPPSAPPAPTKPAEPFIPQAPLTPPPSWQPPTSPVASGTDATLSEIEQAVDSPHLHPGDSAAAESPAAEAGNVDDARSAVEAALSTANTPPAPIAALGAQPLGPDLHNQPAANAAPPVANPGFSEPAPGNSPADETLDMPLPSNPFGPGMPVNPVGQPGQSSVPPSAFPGAPGNTTGTDAPPVPPPFVPRP